MVWAASSNVSLDEGQASTGRGFDWCVGGGAVQPLAVVATSAVIVAWGLFRSRAAGVDAVASVGQVE